MTQEPDETVIPDTSDAPDTDAATAPHLDVAVESGADHASGLAEAAGQEAPAPAAEPTATGDPAAEGDTNDDAAELVDEGEVAADYLEGLLDIADLDGDIDITVENDRPAVSVIEVNAGDLAHLVGDNGKVLAALQDLTRLAVARETGQRSRLMLDIAGHRATRRAELTRQAQDAIAEARSTGAPVRMPAMSAFERKVVHDAVADAGLSSESEGTDPNRHVVITPA